MSDVEREVKSPVTLVGENAWLCAEVARLTAENERLRKEVATAHVIMDSCRENDNHWGDVEVENHRLKAELAALTERLAAAERRSSGETHVDDI